MRTLKSTRLRRKFNGSSGVIRTLHARNHELYSVAHQAHLTQLAFYEDMRHATNRLQTDLILYNKKVFTKSKVNPYR